MLALIGLGTASDAAGAGQDRPAEQGMVKPPPPLPRLAIATDPKVPIAFNRLYDYPELTAILKKLVAGHPELLSLQSLGKSTEGRDLWCVTINNPATGPDRSKPAMYVDGNIHGNEIQGAEAALYLIWYLAENRGLNEVIRRLTDERAFYVVPTINPDGRAYWFNGPNTTHSSRSGKHPLDDDRDGVADEDGYDDLDGDGQITQVRRKAPDGQFKLSPEDPRLIVPIRPGEEVHGDRYELLGMEGIDNDGDGRVNEDPPGGYDLNRNWPADWQPDSIQGGAGDYPLCWPETRAVAAFLRDHPNVAGVQAFHNAAGMILRGPGHASRQAEYPAEDEQVAGEIGRIGARMLPFYRSLVIHRDLYNVHGGFIGWTYEHLGIFSYTNELWNNDQLLGRPEPPSQTPGQALSRAVGMSDQAEQLFANDRLLFGAQFLPWKPFKHPLHGDVELGGFVKQSQRVPPSFLIEELCHRNAAFVVYHAEQMPRLEWDRVTVDKLEGPGGDAPATFAVTASVRNTRSIPTRSRQSAQRKLGLPDRFAIAGPGLTVAGGGPLVNRDTGEVDPVEHGPEVVRLDAGIAGGDVARVRWFVQGGGKATVTFRAEKGGTLTRTVDLP